MVGILILLYGDEKHIPVLSNAINCQTFKDYRVYAVDNRPENPSIGLLGRIIPSLIALDSQGNTGFAGGNNLLAREAIKDGCKYLWVLNPDMEPEADCLEALVNFMRSRPDTGMAGPLLMLGNSKEDPRIQLFGSKADYRTQKKKELFAQARLNEASVPEEMKVDLINAGSLFIRSELIKDSYLFEEKYFMYNDEIDIAKRVSDQGYSVSVISSARVWHHHDWSSTNKAGYNFMYYYMMRNRVLYYYKYKLYRHFFTDLLKQALYFPVIAKFCLRTSGISLLHFYYLGYFHGILNRNGKANIRFS